MKKYLFISFFLLLGIILHAQLQNVEYGLGSDYNFQSGGIGFEARGEIPVYRKFSITPRISYFPAFNSITEAYLGADI